MKKELIEKAALKDSVDGLSRDYGRFDCSAVFDTIDDAPLIDAVEVRHGTWNTRTAFATKTKYQCSECGRTIMANNQNPNIKFPYCHCGAKMDGGKYE